MPVGWVVGLGCVVGFPEGRLLGLPDGVGRGWATLAQYAATLAAPPAVVASFRKVTAFCLALPSAFRCAYAVHGPYAARPVASGPAALAREIGRGPLAWAFWHRTLTPARVLRDQGRPAAEAAAVKRPPVFISCYA